MSRAVTRTILAAAAAALVAPAALAYCLTGVRWPADANVYYNTGGKVTAGQCISSSQMDSAVTSGIGAWRAIHYAGTTQFAQRSHGMNPCHSRGES